MLLKLLAFLFFLGLVSQSEAFNCVTCNNRQDRYNETFDYSRCKHGFCLDGTICFNENEQARGIFPSQPFRKIWEPINCFFYFSPLHVP